MNWRSKQNKVVANLLVLYLIWGSTFLAIKFGIESFPPFLLVGIRFVLASAILLLIARSKNEPRLGRDDLRTAAVSGMFLVVGNALICIAEKKLSSGMTAMFASAVPIWIMVLNWKFFNGNRPQIRQVVGSFIALIGIMLLTQSSLKLESTRNVFTISLLVLSMLCWAFGTLIQRKSTQTNALFRFSGIQLGVGGIASLFIWLGFDQPSAFEWSAVSTSSVFALLYLSLFGSVLAFSSYLWLNRNADSVLVTSHAFINPIVAIWLGWLLVGEAITWNTIVSSLIAMCGLYLIAVKPKEKTVTINLTHDDYYVNLLGKALNEAKAAELEASRSNQELA